jgi:gliding motility-associated-like protein
MTSMLKVLFLFLLLIPGVFFGQKGMHGNYTVTASNVQLNAYEVVTANLSATVSATLSVTATALTNAFFTQPLGPGDLLLIYQAQGATMDVDVTPTASWGSIYTVPTGHISDWPSYPDLWGNITAYNNAGNYELVEVASITNATTIQLMCPVQKNYTAAGHVQIVRVPRLNDLSLASNATIVPMQWNGATGGIVALEINGNLSLASNSKISASCFGFRGSLTENQTAGPASTAADVGFCASSQANQGAEKGESIVGFYAEYDALFSRYGKSAPANGGGGGNYKNAGGGGGSNVGTGTYTGKGIPSSMYAAFWNLEQTGFSSALSAGGGRGGYSGAQSNQDEALLGPNNTAWSGDFRRKEGGLGGHPLTYNASKVFFGGGGGAGEMDNSQGGNGGNGGGLVFIVSYGAVSGTGTIEATGSSGKNSNPLNETPSIFATKKGHDGAGGGGAGGSIIIQNAQLLPTSLTLAASGGNGGNNALNYYSAGVTPVEADGPGGGGTGGSISFSSGTPTVLLTGGSNGIVTTASYPTNIVANFPPNGATNGASGFQFSSIAPIAIAASNQGICSGNSVVLTATVSGTLPTGTQLTWYTSQYGTTSVGTGTTYTTPVLTATTTYYVGFCPSNYRIPVTVFVGNLSLSGTAVVTNAGCSGAGSITGLIASGGVGPLVYHWNNQVVNSINLTQATAGNYQLTVTDSLGCTVQSINYTISGSSPLTIDTSGLVISPSACIQNTGAVSGIQVSGVNPINYLWSNNATTANLTNVGAGNYSLIVTDGQACHDTIVVVVPKANAPIIQAGALQVTAEHCGLSDGIISGVSVSNGTPNYTYFWDNNVQSNASLTQATAGNHQLIVEDALGCSDTLHVLIPSASGPIIDTSNMIVVSAACENATGTISGITISGNSPYSVQWIGSTDTTLSINSLSAGQYNLIVTNQFGCADTVNAITVGNSPSPVAAFTYTTGDLFPNSPITFTDNSVGATQFSWSISALGLINNQPIFTTAFPIAGIYPVLLTVTAANGCIDSTEQFITILGDMKVPNVMTVNADGTNDFFVITNLNANTELIIQNRWGEVVFHAPAYQNDWDGSDTNGYELSDGVYFVQLIQNGAINYKGFVQIIHN